MPLVEGEDSPHKTYRGVYKKPEARVHTRGNSYILNPLLTKINFTKNIFFLLDQQQDALPYAQDI
jgi:hypothetical protein